MDVSNKEKFLRKYISNKHELVLLSELDPSEYVSSRRAEIKQQQEEIESILNSIPDEMERILLQRKFYLGQTYEVISEKIHYSKSQTIRLYKKAIENLEM